MHRVSRRHYSIDEYFAVEQGSSIRHEYYKGEIFAIAGASLRHNHVTANAITALRVTLRKDGLQRLYE